MALVPGLNAGKQNPEDHNLDPNSLILIFPDFISKQQPGISNRMDYFLEYELAFRLKRKCLHIDPSRLKKLIPKFIRWHNNLGGVEKPAIIYAIELWLSASDLKTSIQDIIKNPNSHS